MRSEELPLRSIEHVWDDGPWGGSGYRHEFLSPTVMTWTGIAGQRDGTTDHERYELIEITSSIAQLVFVERKSGLGKSIIYDFSAERVFGTLFPGDGSVFNLVGDITTHERGHYS